MIEAIVDEARSWVGVPFLHQGRSRAGVDCAGLVIAVGEATGTLSIGDEAWRPYSAYGRQPSPKRMGQALAEFLRPVTPEEAMVGDVAWIAWREPLAMHLAILAEHNGRRTLIHALERERRVVEHGFTAEWPALVKAWFRYPGSGKGV